MPLLPLAAEEGLFHEYDPPAKDGAPTFVFVNALTGNTGAWQAVVAPRLRDAGFGTLAYNLRGQVDSPLHASTALTPDLIVRDLAHLIGEIGPPRPILCGLSIGGLFAAQAILGGVKAEGLVLLNTLREIGPRIAWVNDAMFQAVKTGGFPLLLDMFFPLLVGQETARSRRQAFLTGAAYKPEPKTSGHYRLMSIGGDVDWDLPYERLDLPVLVISGHEDRVFFDAAVVDRLVARLSRAERLDWPDAGHLLPVERPERLAEALIAFGTARG